MDFIFSHPKWLFLLFSIPLVFFIHFYSLGNRKKKALQFANFDAISRIEGVDFFSKNIVILFINVLILASLTFAISGLTMRTTAESSSFSYVLAIDSSQSMEADDFSPDRITVAKELASDFVDSSPVDVKIGVVSFSSSSRIEQDMTEKRDELKSAIDSIILSGLGGTDLYDAILTSTNLLIKENQKSVLLLSDGQINVGNLDDAIDYANDNDVIINTIGMGTLEGGETQYALSKLDEDALKSVAYETGGIYFPAQDKINLSTAFSNIFQLTKRKVSIELFDYLILFAIMLVVVKFFLTNTKYVDLI
ncbi:VWA domain-containing protein [Candidatus Pacearchaeota archaeon]|nr:VWA domain-containing protein [Candidatus Pacearchaeota archaeon]